MREKLKVVSSTPAFSGVVAGLAGVVFVLLRLGIVAHWNPGVFAVVGRVFAIPSQVPHGIPVIPGTGYDGEFYLRLAYDPFDYATRAFGITFNASYRLQRVVYPFLSWLAAGGQAGAVPWSLIWVNVAALAATGYFGARLASEMGRPAVWGVVVAGYFGFLFTIGRDTAEVVAIALMVAALVALRQGKVVIAGVVLAAAVLTRETMALVPLALGIVRLAEILKDRKGQLRVKSTDAAWAIPGVVFLAWQAVIYLITGKVPFHSDARTNLGTPFVAMAGAIARYVPEALHGELAPAIWVVELVGLAVVVIWGLFGLRGSSRPYEKVAFALSLVMAVSLAGGIWYGQADFRSLASVYVLAVIVGMGGRRRALQPVILAGLAALWLVTFVHRVTFL